MGGNGITKVSQEICVIKAPKHFQPTSWRKTKIRNWMNMMTREIPMMVLQLKHPLLPSPRLNYVLDLSSAQAAWAFQLPLPLCPRLKITLMKHDVVESRRKLESWKERKNIAAGNQDSNTKCLNTS